MTQLTPFEFFHGESVSFRKNKNDVTMKMTDIKNGRYCSKCFLCQKRGRYIH